MRIVIDTNIAFSAILNTNSKISKIILFPKSKFNFYSTYQLLDELHEHRNKLKQISKYSDKELNKASQLITSKIKFIGVELIPQKLLFKAEQLAASVDIDDTEFIALTEHIRGKLWTGDKELYNGLTNKGWNKILLTSEVYSLIKSNKSSK
jgi:predicted nucleic acid-binding protein